MEGLEVPNCPKDLVPMEPSEIALAVVWLCPECGLVKL